VAPERMADPTDFQPRNGPAQIPSSIQTKSTHPPPPLEVTARHLKAGSRIAPHSVVALIVDNPQCFPAKDG